MLIHLKRPLLTPLLVALGVAACCWLPRLVAFAKVVVTIRPALRPPRVIPLRPRSLCQGELTSALARSSGDGVVGRTLVPIYDFATDAARRADALSSFERIDDVIMGGVSKSQLVEGEGAAAWRGIVRTEGGGFCGQRTKPFATPLNLTGTDGLYIRCSLVSDSDADKRVWKMSMRIGEGRGEVVYQAPFAPPVGASTEPVYVPFSNFKLVRGPVAVPNAPPISNVSAVYQLGFTCSKFIIGPLMTQLEGFRNGTFQLDIAEYGAYTTQADAASPSFGTAVESGRLEPPSPLSEAEVKRRRPLVLRLLLPLLGLVFGESRRRKRRAAQLLAQRGASRLDLMRFSWRFKRGLREQSVFGAAFMTAVQVLGAIAGDALGLLARLSILPIFRFLQRRRMRQELGAEAEKATRLER